MTEAKSKAQRRNPLASSTGSVKGKNYIPRRARMDYWCPAERAIYEATQVVEAMAADVRLTDAVILLGKARDKVADFIDGTDWPNVAHEQPPE